MSIDRVHFSGASGGVFSADDLEAATNERVIELAGRAPRSELWNRGQLVRRYRPCEPLDGTKPQRLGRIL